MSNNQHQEILRTEGLSKFFPGVKALDNVDFSLRRGEIMALLGENGAGKSTLIKALTGVYHADRGTIWLDGITISPKNTAHAQQLGIGTVYQEVNLLPNMSVADNLFIGREPKRFGFLRRKEMEKRATALMESYGFSLDVREPLNRFSVAMQQIVAICRAIDLSAKVLILDEPTASLDTKEVEMLFTLMRQLRDQGVSLIFVTHFLDQVYTVSDRITVLRNGAFVGCRETRELPQIDLVKMMLGRELDTHALHRAGRTLLSDKPIAAFEGFGKKGTIEPFDLQVRPGEIVGLAGLLGSGRTETAEVIFGIKPADSGSATIKGKRHTLRSPHQASCLGIGFCPEDRKTDGIIAAASVRENIILALQAQRGWLRPISRKEQNEIAERFIRQLGIRTPSAEQPIEFLSGGNQQKVLLSRWLLTRPQFLILDEPTRGIDVGAHAEIIRLIETLCADGLALLVISSELEELVNFLIDEFKGKGVNISLPSLRIDAFSLDVMSKVQDIKKSSLTFAPEAGSQRLRDVINKGLTEEVILNGSRLAFEGGWNKVKLYFMLGLPTETEEDMKAIPQLANEIAALYYDTVPKEKRNGKCQITISTSFFVPKPFTPFQWARMYTPGDYLARARVVNEGVHAQLNHKSIKYNWHEADVTVLEGILARGDRKIGQALLKVYEKGGIFDAWSEYFDYQRWVDAFAECGIDTDFYTMRERDLDEIFPWDFIDIGVSKEFLKREWKNAHDEKVTPNCRMKCSGCGAMKFGGGVCFENKD